MKVESIHYYAWGYHNREAAIDAYWSLVADGEISEFNTQIRSYRTKNNKTRWAIVETV